MEWIRRRRVTRGQLEQHVERRAVHGESEQWANEHEQQHRVPLRIPFLGMERDLGHKYAEVLKCREMLRDLSWPYHLKARKALVLG